MSVNPITKVIPRQNAALDNFLHHCHTKKYAARSTIIHAGDESETLYYIIEGSVSVVIEDEDCNEIVLAYLNPGDFFGEMGLFQEDTRRSAWVITRTGQGFDVNDGFSVDTSEPYVLVLPPGWSQIATPFAFPVEVDAIGGLDAVQGPYFYDGTEYQLGSSTLVPWEGYFVQNPGATPVTLAVPAISARAP